MTYLIPDNYEFPKLHNEVERAVFLPETDYKTHYSKIDFSQYDERDLIAIMDYWIGEITILDEYHDRVKFTNRKKDSMQFNLDNFSKNIIDGMTHLCYLVQPYKNGQLHWARAFTANPLKISKGDSMLSHLFCLWYNNNLPLKPLDYPLSAEEQKAKKSKFRQMEWLFKINEYSDPAKGWPLTGTTDWYQFKEPQQKPEPTILQF